MKKFICLLLLMCVIILGGCGDRGISKEKFIEKLNETKQAVTKKTGPISYSFTITYENEEMKYESNINFVYYTTYDLVTYDYYMSETSKTEVDGDGNNVILTSGSEREKIFIRDNKLYVEKSNGTNETYKIYSTNINDAHAAEKKKIDDQLDKIYFKFANKTNIVATFNNYQLTDGEKYTNGKVDFSENDTVKFVYENFDIYNYKDSGNNVGPTYHLYETGEADFSGITYYDAEAKKTYKGSCSISLSEQNADHLFSADYLEMFTE